MNKKNITYDPTDIQINSYEKIGITDMDIEELSNPQVTKMLLHQHLLNLHQLKATTRNLAENEKELNLLKKDREYLRIELAGLNHRVGVDIASIFISFLGGFAINLLSNDWSNGLGWVIFSLCLTILIFFKYPIISKSYYNKERDEEHK